MRHLQIVKEDGNVWRLVTGIDIQVSAGLDTQIPEYNNVQMPAIPVPIKRIRFCGAKIGRLISVPIKKKLKSEEQLLT